MAEFIEQSVKKYINANMYTKEDKNAENITRWMEMVEKRPCILPICF